MLGDAGYHRTDRTLDAPAPDSGPRIVTPFRRTGRLTADQARCNRELAALRAKVEHPFRVLKRQFGFTKVRYRGLAKNTARLHSLFALVNVYLARRRLLATTG